MLGDDPMRQRQTDAVAFWFGGEEGDEDLLQLIHGNSRSGVSHFYNRGLSVVRGSNCDRSYRLIRGDRFSSVAHQVLLRQAEHSFICINL